MRILVVYSHPVPESFNAAVRDTALEALRRGGHDVKLLDLYAEGFDPVMQAQERRDYHTQDLNEDPVRDQIALIQWAEGLLFVYPTWWYGLPAMLKGWLDRVWVPHVTFSMPEGNQPIRPLMTHVRFLGAVTTCGAPWWWSKVVGEPGRRTILRGIRALCAKRCRTFWLAHYKMDASTDVTRKAFLSQLQKKLGRMR
ncbi:NAD(P)H-dependent oxidoreductase [Pelagibius sp. Alg239-R121]|uniref:NAD(P)H-dependent oxidoreductase n=1 Tax=Pelagibius sp. Alg239-R121 TaxID=2993448 RepID=UPI0024A7423C|nr:NAD(P)H-dependent oxidoreductase [Pelagibius sp. Alg239-R121]